MAFLRPNLFNISVAFILMISVTNINAACACFNYHYLIQQFQNKPNVSCHVIHVDNSKILSIRLRDKQRIASASSTNCQLTTPFRNISNDYISYNQSHQNCIIEVVRACKTLQLPMSGADTVLKAKLYDI